MKTTIGGDRLGSGNKQNLSLRNYERSTHDLSYTWRSSMASGTLVPFMNIPALPGDSFDINLNCEVLTLPTIGPLFGSYKVQLDVFSVPIRLYNARLHMNELGIGMDMSNVHLPQLSVLARKYGAATQYLDDNFQVNPSSLLKYLGISGVGKGVGTNTSLERFFNAVPFLAYWDIYKNYYANKQEERGACIHSNNSNLRFWPERSFCFFVAGFGQPIPCLGAENAITSGSYDTLNELNIYYGPGTAEPDPSTIEVSVDSVDTALTDFFDNIVWDQINGVLSCTENNGNGPIESFYVMAEGETAGALPLKPLLDQTAQVLFFDLNNIDTMRKNILRWDQDEAPFIVTGDAPDPYYWHRLEVDTQLGPMRALTFTQEQLALKTYQSDLFNNWISTEWIDGPNGVNEITKVDTSEGAFTIDALNLANKVYNMLNRIAISGGTYDDWLDAVYTHERQRSVENPVYQGSLIKELAFQEVVSTAETASDTSGLPLGTLAGKGRLTGKHKGGKMHIRVDEPSYIMGIVSLTPRVDYSQGNDWHVNLKTLDDLHKPALDAIGFQDLIVEQMAWQSTEITDAGTVLQYSVGKQPAWINYMTAVDKVYGNFADANKDMFMVLNRRYNARVPDATIADLTTYIDPSKFNFIFAQTDLSSQNFWVQISNNVTARRKMSAKVIPNL